MGRLANGPEGWIGVDFDRTLAYRVHDSPTLEGGAPVPSMVSRVRRWLAEGRNVRIMTARVGAQPRDGRWGTTEQQRELIEAWCLEHLGQVLPVTAAKDAYMLELWDDCAVAVEENTGRQLTASKVEGLPDTHSVVLSNETLWPPSDQQPRQQQPPSVPGLGQ